MEPKMTVEGHVPAIAVQHDFSATLIGTTEELVKKVTAESLPRGHCREEVDAPPEVGGRR